MSKPPDFRRVIRDDIPNAPGWVDKVIGAYNLFLEQTYSLFNGNLTIGDNVTGKNAYVTFSTPSDYATGGFNTISFAWSNKKSIQNIIVGSIVESTGAQIIDAVTVTGWTQTTTSNVNVTYITGLQPSKKYTVNLLVL